MTITGDLPAPPAPDTEKDTGPTAVIAGPVSFTEHLTRLGRQFAPPNLWHQPRPPLKATYLWAAHGEHLPDDEDIRQGSRAAAWVLLPFLAVWGYLGWIFERGSRATAAAVLVLVANQWLGVIGWLDFT